ncbi:MAG: hypothetical protein RL641_429 [Candidatus Parcubacteria bacterium]|jgi:hypothetical protein
MLYIVLFVIVIVVLIAIKGNPIEIRSNWHHSFGNFQFSSQEFYQKVEESVRKHEIPNVSFTRVTHSQGGIFSSKREYLRINRGEYVFDICAAPFGTDFFVSWWLGESVKDILARIPILNTILGKNTKQKTYYQMDTEAMFKGSVQQGVLEAIDLITTSKGMRALSELERRPTEMK